VRYLGNKTRLIPFLLRAVGRFTSEPGVACDPFSGTASVASALKRAGWRVHAGDLMAFSYALQVARVELDRTPRFDPHVLPERERNGSKSASYRRVLEHLSCLQGEDGFVTEHYTLAGHEGRAHGRMYFAAENARRIDAIRCRVDRWSERGILDRRRAQLLIATLLEAADRVANTTGVYASFVKTLQPNARRPLELRALRATRPINGSNGCRAYLGPAAELLRTVGSVDLVYLDPPYNGRQYPGYYHIPELLARGWSDPPDLRGKTGLIPDEAERSDWCRKHRAPAALRSVLQATDAHHILFSYNDEGLLPRRTIAAALREWGNADTYRCLQRPYRRYRSDADGPARNYRRDRVHEHLHYVAAR
jgi:adenine-specific DNA-methyltransferase